MLGFAPLAGAQGALVVVGGAYPAYSGLADVNVPIEVPFPRIVGGEPPYTFALSAGALPPPFVTRNVTAGRDVVHVGSTYAVEIGADGALRGATGFPGRFVGTVTVTDANGRTGSADFVLDLDLALAYVGDHEVHVPASPEVVVHGDRVRVSGVPVPALPEQGIDVYFALTFDAAASLGSPSRPVVQEDFDIHRRHGTLSKMTPTIVSDPLRWVYDVVASQATLVDGKPVPLEGGRRSAPIRFTFLRP